MEASAWEAARWSMLLRPSQSAYGIPTNSSSYPSLMPRSLWPDHSMRLAQMPCLGNTKECTGNLCI